MIKGLKQDRADGIFSVFWQYWKKHFWGLTPSRDTLNPGKSQVAALGFIDTIGEVRRLKTADAVSSILQSLLPFLRLSPRNPPLSPFILASILFFAACHGRQETPAPGIQEAPLSPPDGAPPATHAPRRGTQEEGPLGDPWLAPEAGSMDGNITSEASTAETPRKPQGLLIATVDPLAMPWMSSVYAVDTAQGRAEKLLVGESGDPIFRAVKDEIWMFNRSADSQNLRSFFQPFELNPEKRRIGSQEKFPGGGIGDPHDVLRLGRFLLMAHYNEGQLVLMDTDSRRENRRIEADWDLPEGVKLRPASLVLTHQKDTQKSFVYIIHQALSVKDGVFGVNNSQRVFVLSYDPNNEENPLIPVDLDHSLPKIQGIKLQGSFPIPVRYYDQKRLLLVSMCSRFSLMAPPDSTSPSCASAVEEIRLSDHSADLLWDLTNEPVPYYMNGSVFAAGEELAFFAHVERQQAPGRFTQVVARFDAKTKTVSEVYRFRPFSGGFWAGFFDPTARRLYVGDLGQNGVVGHLLVIDPTKPGTIEREIPLDGVPYAGAWVYP